MELTEIYVFIIIRFFWSVSIICFFSTNAYIQADSLPPYNPEDDLQLNLIPPPDIYSEDDWQPYLLPPNIYREEDTLRVRDPIYTIVEQMPSFSYKNGKDAVESYKMYLQDSLRYPSLNGCHGKVFVEFLIQKDGSLSKFRVISKPRNCYDYPKYDKEAVRVLMSMPKWTPGRHEGKNVTVRMILPVEFQ
jgi:protein TonB